MNMLNRAIAFSVATAAFTFGQSTAFANESEIEEVRVISDAIFQDTTLVSPVSTITLEDLKSVNLTTVEDTLAFEPSLVVRKRYIGDPNGVIGLRGSNQFQTTRSMVFVDGMPLHYHLQTRFRGAPRWSLVSPDEIEEAEVVYGPYSSEYSGNAIGGVVNFRTRRPQEERITLESSFFSQDYDQLSTDESFSGYRSYLGYENKFDDLGVFLSYTRLDNDSQPLTQFFQSADSTASQATANSGAFAAVDTFGDTGVFFGDSGAERSTTDLLKLKLFYDLPAAELRASVAYEDRTRSETDRNNFLRDVNGNVIFDREVEIDGQNFDTFEFGRSVFQQRFQDRESLLVGLGASFEVGSSDWVGDAFFSYFDILQDEEIRTGANPEDPAFAAVNAADNARITTFDDTGWNIFDLKFANNEFLGDDRQRLSVGFHYDSYELNLIVDDFNSITNQRSADELDGDRSTGRSDSGGEAETYALFAQYGYELSDTWDLSLGVRYDNWEATNGFDGGALADDRSESGFSPKLSISKSLNNRQLIRYSLARALRFPVIEELFVNNADTGGGSIADALLEPEDGIFHNLSFEQQLDSGSLSVNLFYELVDDVIFNQTTNTGSSTVTTFLPIGEVETRGLEFALEQYSLFGLPASLRFNATYTDTEITENVNNPGLVGNDFPRSPNWRANLLLSYDINESLDVGGSLRYASDSSGELDNSDVVEDVFGSHTDYTFFGVRSNWQATEELKLSLGIDNLFNHQAFVFHRWPSRTYFLSASYVLGN